MINKKKITGIFLIAFVFQVMLMAQNISLKLSNVPIKTAMETLKNEYGYSFVFATGDLNTERIISVDAQNKPIDEVIKQILQGQNDVVYEINNNKNIIVRKNVRGTQNNTQNNVVQPQRIINGTVTDETGAPMPGVNIVLKGTLTGVISDIDGKFSITVPDKDAVLIFSFIGYAVQEITVGEKNVVDISLTEDSRAIEEVVVIGYGTQRRSLVTHAISRFRPDENTTRSALSPTEMLQGRIAGVSASTSSGNLGGAERISIRGASSLSASNQPLYVVDGIPINNRSGSLYSLGEDLSSLTTLNLNDIESIEILKDAASAAIYGSRGTNGVILITTKQGREGRTDVRFNYSFGLSQFPNKNRIKYADSDTWVMIYNEGIDNYNRQNRLVPTDAGYVAHIRNPFDGMPDTDWLDVITRLGVFHNVDASFSGGTQKTKYYIGAGYEYREGVIKTTDINKDNLKVNISNQVFKWLEAGANMSGNYLKNNRVPGAALGSTILARSIEQRPFDRPYKPNGDYYVGGTDELSRHNPVQILNEETAPVDNYRFLGSFFVQATVIPKLTVRGAYNTDVSYTLDYLYYNVNHPYKEENGRVVEKMRLMNTNLFDIYANYDDKWSDFVFGAMAGHSFMKINERNNSIDAQNFPSPAFGMVGSAAKISGVTGGESGNAIESWFGRVNLAYKERYILNATYRADGSSRFAPDCRWGYFPSVSLGWTVTKEPFWRFPSTDLKFRVSYGKTGNQDGISNYGWRPLISGGTTNYNGMSGIAVSSKGNVNLTWETADQYDVGFDLSLLKGKINIMFDTYLKNTNNLLYNMPMHATSGQTSMLSNIGSMRNRGIEFTLDTHFKLGPVNWNSSFNIAHNKNKITKLADSDFVELNAYKALQVGKELGAFYVLRFEGIYQYDGEIPSSLFDTGVRAGDKKYTDPDDNGIINSADRFIVGSPNPVFSGGWNNSFTYKGISLNLFFTYSYGNDVYALWMQGPTRMGNYQGLMQEWTDNRWTEPGSTNRYPRPIYSYHSHNVRVSTDYLKDGSFIKFKSLMLSYRLPENMTKMMRMSNVRVYIQGENLALFSKYPGWDPEISVDLDPALIGVDNYGVPTPRIFKAGINITF